MSHDRDNYRALEQVSEFSSSMKFTQFLEYLNNY